MLINLLDKKKDFCLKGEIILSHCKGNDYIILFLYLIIFMKTTGDY